jgi:negative regulator of flagellin synthesis FlgM
MNNGINLQNSVGPVSASGPSTSSNFRADGSTAGPAAAQKSDQASLSTVGNLLTNALNRVDPTSDVRLEKILPIQQALANGSYHVSASDVAGKIVDSLLS